jgi:hypothetical protein
VIVGVKVGVFVLVGVKVGVFVLVGVKVGVFVGVSVGVCVLVDVIVGVCVLVDVIVGVGVGVLQIYNGFFDAHSLQLLHSPKPPINRCVNVIVEVVVIIDSAQPSNPVLSIK